MSLVLLVDRVISNKAVTDPLQDRYEGGVGHMVSCYSPFKAQGHTRSQPAGTFGPSQRFGCVDTHDCKDSSQLSAHDNRPLVWGSFTSSNQEEMAYDLEGPPV